MRRVSLCAVLLVLFGFGCGNKAEDNTVAAPPSGYDSSPAASSAAEINEHGTKTFTDTAFEVEVELDNNGSDFYFEPTNIKAPGDSTATVKLHNEGSIQHTFTIDSLNIDEELAPDEEKTIEVKLGTERNEFYCRFHAGQGMRGSLQPH